MSDHRQRGYEDDLAYGEDYSQNRGSGSRGGGDRSLVGDAVTKLRTKYDQYSNRPHSSDPYGYGSNSGQQQQPQPQQYGQSGQQGYQQTSQSSYQSHIQGQNQGQNQYQSQYQSQYQGPNQPSYTGGPPPQPDRPQQHRPDLADKLFGTLQSTIQNVGTDVAGLLGTKFDSHNRPSQGGQAYQGPQGAQGGARNRFDSFVSEKNGNDVKWYVDGCAYMWAVSEALEHARESIWILDWWLSPELYLRRPPAANEEWRLDRILARAAGRGVKINVIVYKEVTQALTLSSSHTKHALEALSSNIGVFRHPDHLPDAQTAHSSLLSSFQGLKLDAAGASKLGADALRGIYGFNNDVILYWAHHEKLCLIDHNIAFMGGLDLCYGRWDTNQHSIADAHPSDLNKIVFPGQDFNNARVMDFDNVANPFQNKLDRTKSSRMGWSDISICLRGPCVQDLCHHFTDRWNFIYDEKYNVRKDVRYQRLPPAPGHYAGENPQTQSSQGQSHQQNLQPGQYPPPPGNQGYTQPPWQQTSRPHTPSAPVQQGSRPHTPLAATQQQGSRPHSPLPPTNQYAQGQQTNYPPPPPGPAPLQSYPPPPPGPAPQQSYPPPSPNTSVQPPTQGPQQGYTGPQQSQSQSQYTPPFPTNTQELPTAQSPYQHQSAQSPQPQYSTGYPSAHQESSAGQPHYDPYSSQQSHSPQPPYQQAYTGNSQAQPHPQQSQYSTDFSGHTQDAYSGQPQYQHQQYGQSGTTRGLDENPDYHDSEEGTERGFGGSRVDRYKTEGRMLGNELGALGNMITSRVENKISSGPGKAFGGSHGRPQSRHGGPMACQLIRSCTKWSNGTPTEHSIQNAYIDVITKSQHFIYIENQFFITATGEKQHPVRNQIGKALVDRILRAARNGEKYHVIVVMPAIPAFAGDFSDDQSLGTRAICEFQYNSICRGGESIMEKIAQAGFNPMDYIRFYNLRNYDRINYSAALMQAQQQSGVGYEDARRQQEQALGAGYAGQGYGQETQEMYASNPAQQYQSAAQSVPHSAADQWDSVASCYMLGGQDIRSVPWSGPPEAELDAFVSEELYVHSKVMIADDRIVICGSANLNDRSMLGTHDSEIALIINDPTPVQSTMCGRPWQANRFAASLRRQLVRKHIGLIPAQDYRRPNANFEPLGPQNLYDWGSPEDHVVSDPLSETFQSLWNTRARTNTEVFRKTFRAIPDDNVRSWGTYKEFYEYYFHRADSEAAGKDKHDRRPARVEYGHAVREDFQGGVKELKDHLSQVRGTLVEMPLCFLQSK